VDTTLDTKNFVPFPDFGHGSSYRNHQWQQTTTTRCRPKWKAIFTRLELLATYTYSKSRTDAGDYLTAGAPLDSCPGRSGAGIRFDYGLASFDIRHVFPLKRRVRVANRKGQAFLVQSRKDIQCDGRRVERELERYAAGRATHYVKLSFRHSQWNRLL